MDGNPTELSFHVLMEVDAMLEMIPSYIVCVDVETTGLSPTRDEVLQIAMCDGSGNMLLESYVRPERRKSWPKAQEVNHISPDMVEDAPTLIELSEQIESILAKASYVIGYNIDRFDLEFLRVGRVNMPPDMRTYDLINDCSVMFGKWSDYHGDYSYVSLEKVAGEYGIEYDSHDAAQDVRATVKVFRSLLSDERLRFKVAEVEAAEDAAREEREATRMREEEIARQKKELAMRQARAREEKDRRDNLVFRGCIITIIVALVLLMSTCGSMCSHSSRASRRTTTYHIQPVVSKVTPLHD